MDHNRAVSSESEFLQWLRAALDAERERLLEEPAEISRIADWLPASHDMITRAQRREGIKPHTRFSSWQVRLHAANSRLAEMHGTEEKP